MITTNNAITELSSTLIRDGYEFVSTGRFQTDPLEIRFSHYRQMSGSRFIVSLTEVLRSESIISYQALLKREIDFTKLQLHTKDDINQKIEEFILGVHSNPLEHLVLSNDTKDVVVYVSGYITRSLLCQDCSELFHKDPIETCFVSAINRGGLQLTFSIFYSYVESAFCCIEYLETKMLATKLPLKLLICTMQST